MQQALHYSPLEGQSVQCHLCPHHCILENGHHGKCNTRVNREGTLITESYGILSSISIDPIEKKPLYHFYPGHSILSIGSFGCNLSCDFCQNCEISQIDHHILTHYPSRDPEDIVHKALLHPHNIGLAYTYNEPTVYYEYMIQCAALIKEKGQSNVMVTNGYLNREPLEELLPYMDAFNVDLKSFRNEFYQKHSSASLNPVLKSISRIASTEKHLELTFLIIPGLNDSEQEWRDMMQWILDHCGREAILHVSRYFPRYKLNNPPTPLRTIQRFLDLARDSIQFVYPGNTPHLESHTVCPGCGTLLIQRNLYQTTVSPMLEKGFCKKCKYNIPGVFKMDQS